MTSEQTRAMVSNSEQPAETVQPIAGQPIVGIVGGGQLARMLAEAAFPLGVHVRLFASPNDEGAAEVIPDVTFGSIEDREALIAFANTVDVLTFDHENISHDILVEIESIGSTRVAPSVHTLRFSDKAYQRRSFSEAGLPVPPFVVVNPTETSSLQTAIDFSEQHGRAEDDGKIVLKASRGGYDGRGVWMLTRPELDGFFATYEGAPLVLEPLIDLDIELAVLVARSATGEVATWPVVETVQVNGMCDEVILPAPVDEDLHRRAAEIAERVSELTQSVGVLAIELFVTNGELLINEIAPRVHNSGHVTIEGSATSQFAQHIRAILGWPLGPTDSRADVAVMRNIVGEHDNVDPRCTQARALAEIPEAHIHLYGKTVRAERKIGHLTVLGVDQDDLQARALQAANLLVE